MYVDGAKLASVGLRIRRGASYHGVALNVSLDLAARSTASMCAAIEDLRVTRLVDHAAALPTVTVPGHGGAGT